MKNYNNNLLGTGSSSRVIKFNKIFFFLIFVFTTLCCMSYYWYLVQVLADSATSDALKPMQAFSKNENWSLLYQLKDLQYKSQIPMLHLVGVAEAINDNWHIRAIAKLSDLLPYFQSAAEYCYSNGNFDIQKGFFNLIYKVSLDPSLPMSNKFLEMDIKKVFESYCSVYKSYLELLDAMNNQTLTVEHFRKFAKAVYSLSWFADPSMQSMVLKGGGSIKGSLGDF